MAATQPEQGEPETTGWDPLLPEGRPYQPGKELAASLAAGHTESLAAYEKRGTIRRFLTNRNRGNQ